MTSRSRAADERDSDTTLIARARHGDERAVELLLNRHVDRVHAICRCLLGNPGATLDATQEALIAIARGIVAFDGRSASTTWLYRVATNAALDDGRRVAALPAEFRVAVVLRDLCDLDSAQIADVLGLPPWGRCGRASRADGPRSPTHSGTAAAHGIVRLSRPHRPNRHRRAEPRRARRRAGIAPRGAAAR